MWDRFVRLAVGAGFFAGLVLALSSEARAQDPTPAEPWKEPTPATPPAPNETPTEKACRPDCRENYVCVDGQCVSVCNPPCGEGEQCTADARCVRRQEEFASQPPALAPEPPLDGALEADDEGGRVHDGFYLRMAAGLGYMSATRTLEASAPLAGTITADESLTGVGQLFEISFGGSVSPGVIIGGGVYQTHVFTTNFSREVKSSDSDLVASLEVEDQDVGASTLALMCPFVNVYFQPRSGFNMIAGPCAALADLGNADMFTGFGVNLGIGGDWFVHRDWSLGVLFRAQYASVSHDNEESLSIFIPGALFTATYN